jgi:peptidoglycan/LPS O-acetylase OafA/YrhL
MDTLALGAVLAIAWRRHRNKITAYGVYGPIASLIALGVLLVLKEQMPSARLSANSPLSNTLTYECTLMICGGVILWALSGRFVGILNWAPVRYLGRVSYSVYLIHLVPMHFLRFYYHGPKIVGWVAVVVATLAYAALSWHFFEQPILAGRPRGSTRRRMEEEERAAGGATLEVGDTQVPMLELAASPPSETAP